MHVRRVYTGEGYTQEKGIYMSHMKQVIRVTTLEKGYRRVYACEKGGERGNA